MRVVFERANRILAAPLGTGPRGLLILAVLFLLLPEEVQIAVLITLLLQIFLLMTLVVWEALARQEPLLHLLARFLVYPLPLLPPPEA